jgi:hypothetical protein
MFEIIMLFAFLYVATCQLFPKRPATSRSFLNRKTHLDKKKTSLSHLSSKKRPKPSAKTRSRNHSYARAA